MDLEAVSIYELSRDPVVSIEAGSISYMNAAARSVFPADVTGRSASLIIPPHLLMQDSDSFVSSAFIGKAGYTVSARRHGGVLTLLFTPDETASPGGSFVSKSMLISSRSALFNMSMSIDLIREHHKDMDEREAGYFAALQHSCALLTKHITNLDLAISLADGSADFSPTETNLTELLRELCSASGFLTRDGRAKIEFSTQCENLIAELDVPKLRQMLLNIISNSLKNTPADGTVRLELGTKNDRATITVSDNGRGIEPDILRHVFSKFSVKANIDELSVMGEDGLGLCIASGIARLHSGALLIESKQGRGTVATVMLPLRQVGKLEFRNVSHAVDSSLPQALVAFSDILDSSRYTEQYLD